VSNKQQKNRAINFNLIQRILSYTKPYKNLFFIAIAITLVLSAVAIVRPLLISYTLNAYVAKQKSVQGLNVMCLIIFTTLITEALLQIINLRVTNLLGQNIVKDLRSQVYKHIINLKNTYFDNTPVGMLVTRAISDIESLSDVFAQGFIVIAGDLVMLLVFICVMLFKNWVLALLAFTTIPLLFIATALFKKGVKKTFTLVRNAVSNLNTFTQEHIIGMRLVQLFNREAQEFEKFKEINKQHREANIRSIFYYSVFFPIVEILSSISIAMIIWYSGLNAFSLHISLGDITFFIMMVNMLFRPIRLLADRLNTLQMGFVSAERVFKVLDTDEKINNAGDKFFELVKNKIEFKNIWFAYKDDNFVLKNVSFKIEAGKTVAMIGATGAGKSTIINLLSRFYEYNKGEILMDGIEIKNYELSSLRKNTGVVLQDVHLFNDTILNNITLNNPDITLNAVTEATKQIGLYEYVMSLPNGFNYQVTERGQSLSAGQRQLIAFIRAYVYQPSIFILDEATATIDTQTEMLIQKATQKISEGRTSIVIAHRLSTIKHVDKILVFDKGEIIEEGTIAELLGKESRFKKMYELNYSSETLLE
jgi:ATP-binding cassette subfamily B protein